jgi:hypothetical protein
MSDLSSGPISNKIKGNTSLDRSKYSLTVVFKRNLLSGWQDTCHREKKNVHRGGIGCDRILDQGDDDTIGAE